jgi:hypothetical protein
VGTRRVLGQQDREAEEFGQNLEQLGLGQGPETDEVQADQVAVLGLERQGIGDVGGPDQAARDQFIAQQAARGRGGRLELGDDEGGGQVSAPAWSPGP